LGGSVVDAQAAATLWRDVREQRHAAFAGASPLWRFAVASTAPPLSLGAGAVIEWNGAQRWLRTSMPAASLRERARELGGHATLFRNADSPHNGDAQPDVFTPSSAPLAAIQRRLQDEFDPARIFNRGRMVREAES
ncbi:MAG: hypothetical protein LBE59_05200, partial [Nevskiaceae bacterium]|nr:hypothetical protein [Nevskiaceae bacterium]